MYVYKLVNNIDERIYVGQTKNINRRFKYHIDMLNRDKHHSIYLQRFYNKYENCIITYEILFESDDKDKIDEYELEYINNTYEINFNVSKQSGGGDLISYHPNRDDIVARSRATSAINISNLSEEERQKKYSRPGKANSNYKHGLTLVEVHCKGCNKTLNKSYYVSGGHKLCRSCLGKTRIGDKNPFYGKKHTEEYKRNASIRRMGIPNEHDSISVEVDGIRYSSYTAAAKVLGCSVATVSNRVKNLKFPNYKNID